MMLQRLIQVAALMIAFHPSLVMAQAPATPPPTPETAVKPKLTPCELLAESIEQPLKSIDMARAESIGDNSAPRATLSNLKINGELLLVSMNLQLARDNGCPTRKEPLRTGRYLVAALKCQNDILRASFQKDVSKSAGSEIPTSCETNTWQPLTE